MLFNSLIFIYGFIPPVLTVFYLSNSKQTRLYILILASLVFYGYWSLSFLPLLVASIVINYFVGRRLSLVPNKRLLIGGCCFNLALIGYFKYAGFFAGLITNNVPDFLNSIILPLGISFFTFQQISFLVDCHKANVSCPKLDEYAAFVLFFPQLIAGPIVHHNYMISQFQDNTFGTPNREHIEKGLILFVIGLAKKVLVADWLLSEHVNTLFASADTLSTMEAWIAALSYSFQIYFDFSGYCEMAMGISLWFGLTLPINFNSPYKANSVIDFWHRWHITLGEFFRNYVYIPLGGNRKGFGMQLLFLMITASLSGIWHGAGHTFIVWGGMHGVALAINHTWRRTGLSIPGWFSRMLTLIFVVNSWVIFRAGSLSDAGLILSQMWHFGGETYTFSLMIPVTLVLSLACIREPNVHQMIDCPKNSFLIRYSAVTFIFCFLQLSNTTEFLYFNF